MHSLGRLGELPLLPQTIAELEAVNGGPIGAARADTRILLISTATTLGAEQLDALPELAHVALCGTSYGRIDTDAIAARGISSSNVRDYSDEATAEVVFMQLVSLARGFGPYQWRSEPRELAGKALVIVGLGALGGAMAGLGLAYGMDVSYISRSAKPEWEARGLRRRTRGAGLDGAEVVILTGPTDVEVLAGDDLAHLDGAIVVQASVGRVVDPAAFRAWIAREGNHAVFDGAAGHAVREDFARLPRVVFPQTVAGLSHEALQRLGARVVENVRGALAQL